MIYNKIREKKIMKVLLIQPPQIFRDVVSIKGEELPLNLAYLASAVEHPLDTFKAYGRESNIDINNFAKTEKFSADIIDLQLFNQPLLILTNKIKDFKPDIVGITALTLQVNFIDVISKLVKKNSPNTLIVFGGIHASAIPCESLKEMSNVDMVVFGEGEQTFLEICIQYFYFLKENNLPPPVKKNLNKELTNEYYKTNSEQIEQFYNYFKKVKGICFRGKNPNEIIKNEPRPLIRDINLLKFPAREKLKLTNYNPGFSNYIKLPEVLIMASRGCPYNCTFCSKAVYHQIYRRRTPENLIEEMEQCEKDFGVHDFTFSDDTISLRKEWMFRFCKLLIEKKKNYHWNAFSRIDGVSRHILILMKRAGCYLIKYGVESGSKKILREVNKKTTPELATKVIKMTLEIGIEVQACYIIFFPNESMESIQNTIKYAKNNNSTYAVFAILKPFPGSKIYIDAKKNDLLIHTNWRYYGEEDAPILKNQILNVDIARKTLRNAYNQYYLSFNYFFGRLKDIIKFFSITRIIRLLRGFLEFLPRRR